MAVKDLHRWKDPEEELPHMSLAEHLDELRRRVLISVAALFVCWVAAFVYWKPIWHFVQRPYLEAATLQGLENPQLLSLDPGEGFLTVLKLAFLVGFVAASPVVLWQMWGFVSAGLYRHEKRVVRVFFPVSMVLFALGCVLAYQILIPFGFRFLIGWNVSEMGISSGFRAQTYVSTCLMMVFGMAFMFELPLVMLFLQATGIVQRKTFQKGWRIAVVLAFVIGMFLTDPSPVTQVMMALPIVGLYFMGIWGGRFVGEDRETFRWYKAWPLVLGLAVLVAMLVFSDEINQWSSDLFGGAPAPAPKPPP
jgi:sec-independent protein translocase protein TatC